MPSFSVCPTSRNYNRYGNDICTQNFSFLIIFMPINFNGIAVQGSNNSQSKNVMHTTLLLTNIDGFEALPYDRPAELLRAPLRPGPLKLLLHGYLEHGNKKWIRVRHEQLESRTPLFRCFCLFNTVFE